MPANFITYRARGTLAPGLQFTFFPNGGAAHEIPSERNSTLTIPIVATAACPATTPPIVGVNQAFCSVLNLNAEACNSPLEGSPLIGANNLLVGFLVNGGGCLTSAVNPLEVVLHFHNIGQFDEWIRLTSGSKMNAFSVLLILSTLLMSLKNLF